MNALREWFQKRVNQGRLKSPWIMHFDCGACNGCDIEVLACLTPLYDVERFGIVNVGNPKHADVLLVTGSVNSRNKHVLKNLYDQMPEPKAVIAIGACGLSGGIFRECYNVVGGIDKVIPVDVYVPGCPAKPEAIIDGVVAALEKVRQKLEAAAAPDAAVPAQPETEQAEAGPESGAEADQAGAAAEPQTGAPGEDAPAAPERSENVENAGQSAQESGSASAEPEADTDKAARAQVNAPAAPLEA